MKTLIFTFLILSYCVVRGQKTSTPVEKALAAVNVIESGEGYNIGLPTNLACLTNIFPEEVDLNYVGICYKPTIKELHLWRDWILKNEKNLRYDINEPESEFDFIFGDFNIIFIDHNGMVRDSNCNKH